MRINPVGYIHPAETALMTALVRMMAQSAEQNQPGSLLLVNIQNLAMILNAYGQDVSVLVMHEIKERIAAILSPGDYIDLLQRDQLAIVLSNSFPEDTGRMAERIHMLLQNYGRDNFTTASLHIMGIIGAVHFPSETKEASDALNKAYVAVNSMQPQTYRTFESTQREADICRQQMGLANYLYSAFKEDRLRLAWQPIVDAQTGAISHYEALLRMVSPSGKISSAGALIPVAEKMGLIEEIDKMVVSMVARELSHTKNVVLGFNVSSLTTENPQWLELAHRLVDDKPEVASRMIVEITETAVQRDLRRVAFFVASLQALGTQVALDDFGSGYTSFRQLKALSVDMVKIDGAFVKDIAQNADNRFFVKTLLDFSRAFGLKSVAEYVESGEIAKILMELGVDYMQGYYFGKPENHRSWLSEGEYRKD